jgi:M6 family metalloprotease-like protein
MRKLFSVRTLAVALAVFSLSHAVEAVAPSKEAVEQFKAEGRWEQVRAMLKAFRDAGGCQPVADTKFTDGRFREKIAASPNAVDTMFVPVILVDFPDFRYNALSYSIPGGGTQSSPAIGTNAMFDSILFSRKAEGGNPTGSMTDYYFENSYGKLVITGDVYGWYTVPGNYSTYVGTTSGLGGGGALLAHDAVDAAVAAGVDFTPYDNDDNNSIDGVIVIHAGPGAETGAYGIWSHRSNMSPNVLLPNLKFASAYTLNPEEFGGAVQPIGVFCHEFGHVLGLPDLYTTADVASSEGLGEFSLMASGNYNGGSKVPSHFDPWCKKQLGFISLYDHMLSPSTNLYQAAIPQAESEPFAYYITPSINSLEYWLVENRQWYGFDADLPGKGLFIYHVDEAQTDNNDPAHYKVALLQADGQNSLNYGGSRGDYGDPFPGTSQNRNFHDLSVPNSRAYNGSSTQIAAWRISDADSIMYADLDTRWSRPWVYLSGSDSILFSDPLPGGNANGIMEAGETVLFSFGVRNKMRIAYGSTATLSCNDTNISMLTSSVPMDGYLSPSYISPTTPVEPLKFYLPPDWKTHLVTFQIRLVMDSILNSGDTAWNTSFTFTQPLGRTQILLVDDDNGKTYESRYGSVLTNLGLPYAVWNKKTSGNPLWYDLAPYKTVIWFLGGETGGGVIDEVDIASMKAYLDIGGNLCLAGIMAAPQIVAVDTAFMSTYLHAQSGGLTPDGYAIADYDGVDGNAVSNGISVGISTAPVTYMNTILHPVNGGQATFTFRDEFGDGDYGNGGVIYDGTYRTVFLSFAPELTITKQTPVVFQPLDTLVARVLGFFDDGAASGVDDHEGGNLPRAFALEQNYPNPFNPSTVIAYTIPAQSGVRLQRTTLVIYNLMGQEVATLVDRAEGPGTYSVTWDGLSTGRTKTASGAYFYRLSHGEQSLAKKMILLK